MFCKQCGINNVQQSKFCKACGVELVKVLPEENVPTRKNTRSGNGIWVVASVLAIIFFIWLGNLIISSDTPSTTTPVSVSTPAPASSMKEVTYNQEEIASSVVNIYCQSTRSDEDVSGGSGTIMTEEGIILTNSHIIPQDDKNIYVDETGCIVILPDPSSGQAKEMYWAKPISFEEISDKYDLAFLSIYAAYKDEETNKLMGSYPRKFPSFDGTTRCENENIQLGESVRIFGYPEISGGHSLTITDGIVSSFPGDGLVVTSAKISNGNSGGLAVDRNGCMIGIPSMVSADSHESLGVIISTELIRNFYTEVNKLLEE